MGRPKPLLPWDGTTLVESQVANLLEGGVDNVYVVTGKSDTQVSPILTGLKHTHRVHNPDFLEGKTTSIRAGIAALPPDIEAIVLLAVDQPRPAWVIRRVLESHLNSDAPLTSPSFHGHGGHPLVFAGELRNELTAVTEENQGIRELFRKHEEQMNTLEFESEIIRLDLNTPEAYNRALARYPELCNQEAL